MESKPKNELIENLKTLEKNELVEFDNLKQQQLKIVEENPFVEIVDSETYKLAKKRRTSLKTGRTGIEKQDKVLGTFFSNIRKKLIGKKDELVDITKPHEVKQQLEIDRWEKIKEEEKQEAERIEADRIAKHKQFIEDFKADINEYLGSLTIDNKDDLKTTIINRIAVDSEVDLQEFSVYFENEVEQWEVRFDEKYSLLEKQESDRIANEKIAQSNNIKDLKLKFIDKIDKSEDEKLVQFIDEQLYQFEETQNFELVKDEFSELKDFVVDRAMSRVDKLIAEREEKEQKLKEEQSKKDLRTKSRIELLEKLGLVYFEQMSVFDLKGHCLVIKLEKVKDCDEIEWSEILTEIECSKQEIVVKDLRVAKLIDLGFKEVKGQYLLSDFCINSDRLYNMKDEDFDAFIESYNNHLIEKKKHDESVKRLSEDKDILNNFFENLSIDSLRFETENNETKEFFEFVEKSFSDWKNTMLKKTEVY